MEKFIGIILVTLLIAEYAEPIQFIKRTLSIDNLSDPKTILGRLSQKFFNCSQCIGFWAGLIVYQDIYMAAIISFASEITHKSIEVLYFKLTTLK